MPAGQAGQATAAERPGMPPGRPLSPPRRRGLRLRRLLLQAHGLHHVGHLAMHLQQLVDLLDVGAGAGRNALLARWLEDVRVLALLPWSSNR
jgi:hypothetical protein